jgi:S-adenosylmethionine:tRNA ribosyltransferase-isomerase
MSSRLEDYDFYLPPERIARVPTRLRDRARLLTLDRVSGAIGHARFLDLPGLLRAGDLLVLNDTAVRQARLFGRRAATGGRVEALLLAPQGEGMWRALVRGASRAGTELVFARGTVRATLAGVGEEGEALLAFDDAGGGERAMAAAGYPPLPPYIRRREEEARRRRRSDRSRYQTVFARRPCSVAAPTAGLHFTGRLFERLGRAGISTAFVTLEVGAGTFRPIRDEDIALHRIEPETVEIPPETAAAIGATRARGGRVVAVGTTVTRALEAFADGGGGVASGRGLAGLYIRPGHRFRALDALVTNFHLPKSSLLVLAAAFAGRERLLAAYAEAVERGYRFYSFGDAMVISSQAAENG